MHLCVGTHELQERYRLSSAPKIGKRCPMGTENVSCPEGKQKPRKQRNKIWGDRAVTPLRKTETDRVWLDLFHSCFGTDFRQLSFSLRQKQNKTTKKHDFSPVLNRPRTWNCKLCYIKRALSITDQVRGFILWKISKERARVWFRRCTTRHCAMPKGKRKNRSTDVSNISNNSSVGNTTLNPAKKNKSQRRKQ